MCSPIDCVGRILVVLLTYQKYYRSHEGTYVKSDLLILISYRISISDI